MNFFRISCLFYIALHSGVTALHCFECKDAYKPYYCEYVAQCGPREECFVDQYVTSSGGVLYKSGCRSPERCQFRKREIEDLHFDDVISDETTDVITCSHCCNDTDYCNLNGCQQNAQDRLSRGPLCFNCDKQTKHGCRHITQCDSNYICGITKVEQSGETLYNSHCVHQSNCNAGTTFGSPLLIGKRSQQTDRADRCPKCCDQDFCNEDCSLEVDGGLTDWGPWSSCSATCGQGDQKRHRSCSNPQPANGGKDCDGPLVDLRLCQGNSTHCPVDGVLTEWGDWSACSITCSDFQFQRRHRTCTNPRPSHGGTDCPQNVSISETRRCHNLVKCPAEIKCESVDGYNVYMLKSHLLHEDHQPLICVDYSHGHTNVERKHRDAVRKCEADPEGSHLMTLDSKEEEAKLFGRSYENAYPGDPKPWLWIGLKYDHGWHWTDGRHIGEYARQKLGSNYDGVTSKHFDNGACVLSDGHHWSLADCDELHHYVCEIDV